MAVNEIETNSDIQSKKRKKSKASSKKESIELSTNHDDTAEEISSVPANVEKKRKSKKLKLTVESESVEVTHNASETSSKYVSNEKSEEASAPETPNCEFNPSQENDSLVNQSKRKKKKEKKSRANSDSVQSNSSSNATKSEKSKKKKWKKKKSKKKTESSNSPSKKNSSNSNTASSRNEKAISYLETWKNDKDKWKFEKLTQIWLFKNMFDENMVIFQFFSYFLQFYFSLLIFKRVPVT